MITSEIQKQRTFELKSTFEFLLKTEITAVQRINGGKNNQIYKIECSNSKRYAAKIYFPDLDGARDRFNVEFQSLKFLWNLGERRIPEPIVSDRSKRIALYGFVEGVKLSQAQYEISDLEEAINFLCDLQSFRENPGAANLLAASEACFSIKEIIGQLKVRIEILKLAGQTGRGLIYDQFRSFIKLRLLPLYQTLVNRAFLRCEKNDYNPDQKLSRENQVLSPSDFGFHNSLKTSNGIIFLDFEYFGWDDPIKLISDFILHPGMTLSADHQDYFIGKIIPKFSNDSHFKFRLAIAYPLFGIKWCILVLNEFIPEFFARRQFAGLNNQDKTEKQKEQLQKAEKILDRVTQEVERFSEKVK